MSIHQNQSWQRCHTWLERNQEELVDIVVDVVVPTAAGSPRIQEVLKANLLAHFEYVLSTLKLGTLRVPLKYYPFNLQEFPGEVNSDALYDRAFSLLPRLVNSKNRDFTVDGVLVGDDGVKALRKLVERLAEAYEGSFVF